MASVDSAARPGHVDEMRVMKVLSNSIMLLALCAACSSDPSGGASAGSGAGAGGGGGDGDGGVIADAGTDAGTHPTIDASMLECRDALPLRCGDRLSHNTEVEGQPNLWGGYNPSARVEQGRETVYAFQSDERCQVSMQLSELDADIDLFVMTECDPSSCFQYSSTPLDIQSNEAIGFQAEPGRDYVVAVDGNGESSGSYVLTVGCLCSESDVSLANGEWLLRVNRRWNGDPTGVESPSTPLPEEDYEPITAAPTYNVGLGLNWSFVAIGNEPISGPLTPESGERFTYDLTSGTSAGGRFVIWANDSGLQAELTIYGSGVPIASSERGPLTPKP
jgi:hypothetical protein